MGRMHISIAGYCASRLQRSEVCYAAVVHAATVLAMTSSVVIKLQFLQLVVHDLRWSGQGILISPWLLECNKVGWFQVVGSPSGGQMMPGIPPG